MGAYTDQLFKKRKDARKQMAFGMMSVEHLTAAAIERDGVVHSDGARAHWEIRYALGDENPQRGQRDDVEGFLTSEGRFLTRWEAMKVGEIAGQCRPTGRELLSSDIDWPAL